MAAVCAHSKRHSTPFMHTVHESGDAAKDAAATCELARRCNGQRSPVYIARACDCQVLGLCKGHVIRLPGLELMAVKDGDSRS